MQKVTAKDLFFMGQALALAGKGSGRVHPNPLVGALVVKNGRIVGRGAHLRYGGPHAETHAIQDAGHAASGATLYVTLEPCAHTGKTPPCAELILKSRLKKVVIGARDPNLLVAGKGISLLRKNKIQVVTGALEAECSDLNRDFNHWIKKHTPYVLLKVAQSLDGKIATRTGESKWITGEKARVYGHTLRAGCDAILVGVKTVLKDDPLLSVRYGALKGKHPLKVVLDSRLHTPSSAKLFSKKSPGPVLLAVTSAADKKKFVKYANKAEILVIKSRGAHVDLAALLKTLGARGVVRVLIEGGAELIADAIEQGLAHEFYFFTAPKIIGGRDAKSSVGGKGIASMSKAVLIPRATVSQIGSDILIHGRF